jgi:hypothetical protein
MMHICTADGAPIVQVDGLFEDAYPIALSLWNLVAGDHHCDGLQIWEESGDIWHHHLTINYSTHER